MTITPEDATEKEKTHMDGVIVNPTIEQLRGLSEKYGLEATNPFIKAIAILQNKNRIT